MPLSLSKNRKLYSINGLEYYLMENTPKSTIVINTKDIYAEWCHGEYDSPNINPDLPYEHINDPELGIVLAKGHKNFCCSEKQFSQLDSTELDYKKLTPRTTSGVSLCPIRYLSDSNLSREFERLKKETVELLEGLAIQDNKATGIFYRGYLAGLMYPRIHIFKHTKYYRTGAIFITKKFRNNGIARRAISIFFKHNRPGLSWIPDNNFASIKAFKNAGFVKSERKVYLGQAGYWYVLN